MASGSRCGRAIASLLFAGVALLAPAAAAPQLQDADVMTGGRADGRVRLLWENDSWFSSSDRFYTNGAAIGFTVPDGPFAATLTSWFDFLPFRAPAITGTATEFTLAQEMFTPEDIAQSMPVLDDRPYAGWLHLDTRHQILTLDRARRQDMLDTWLLQLGVVGTSSLADDVQTQIHEMVGAPRPQGWSNQLHDEPGIVLGFRRDFRGFHDPKRIFGLESDFEGHYGLALGNVETSARVGAQVRIGKDLPRHFGTSIRCRDEAEPWRLFATAGVSGRAIARDIFLDGNTYRDSQSIDRNYLVADFHVGLHFELSWARLSVVRVFRTPEFDSPSTAGDPSSWMSVQLEVLF